MTRDGTTRIARLLAYRWPITLVGLLACLLFFPLASQLEFDGSPERFFVDDAEGAEAYAELRDQFGSDRWVRVTLSGPSLWEPDGVDALLEIQRVVKTMDGIERSILPFRPRGSDAVDRSRVRPDATFSALEEQLGLIDADRRNVSLLVALDGGTDEEARTLDELIAATDSMPPGITRTIAGIPTLDRALDDAARDLQRKFLPPLILVSVVIMVVVFRRWRSVVSALFMVAISQGLILGVMALVGAKLDLVMTILPPLLFVIATATAIHLVVRFDAIAADAPGPLLPTCAQVYHEKGWALICMGMTTMVGFSSLALSKVGPVQMFGLWTAFGIGVITITMMVFGPGVLTIVQRPRRTGRREHVLRAGVGRRIALVIIERRWLIFLAALLIMSLGVAGLFTLRVESNALNYLSPTHPARAAIVEQDQSGLSSATIDVLVGGEKLTPDRLVKTRKVVSALRDIEGVHGVVGASDVVEQAARPVLLQTFYSPMGWALALRQVEQNEAGREVLRAFAAESGLARIIVFIPIVDDETLRSLMGQIEQVVGSEFDDVQLTGRLPQMAQTQRYLLSTLITSFVATVLIITLIFRLLVGSWRLAGLSMFPNLWPVICTLGLMGAVGTPLDVATVMIAAVVLGLAVDDTIQTLTHFRQLAPTLGPRDAVARTLSITAPAYVTTGLVLSAGFSVLCFSSFLPTARFGLWSAIAILLAVLGDLVLLPAVLAIGGEFHRSSKSR